MKHIAGIVFVAILSAFYNNNLASQDLAKCNSLITALEFHAAHVNPGISAVGINSAPLSAGSSAQSSHTNSFQVSKVELSGTTSPSFALSVDFANNSNYCTNRTSFGLRIFGTKTN